MDLTDKIVLAHRGCFSSLCQKSCRENSADVCKLSSSKGYLDIFELDLRKSKDGVLYCFHGSFFQYYFTLKVPRAFSKLKAKYNVDTLQEVLDSIPETKSIFLDIKSTNIAREEVLKAFESKNFKEVILGNKSKLFLKRFHNMPRNFSKIMNGNIFCNFYNLLKLKEDGYKYLEVVFPFQATLNSKLNAEKAGLEFRMAGIFFLTQQSYWNKVNKLTLRHVSSDFID